MILSQQLGYYLDNPRTDEEVSTVRNYLVRAYTSGHNLTIPVHSKEPIVTIEDTLKSFKKAFSKRDAYVKEIFKTYRRKEVFDFLARIWVIARYKNDSENVHREYYLIDESLASYCYILSLLIHTDGRDYFGECFVIPLLSVSGNQH